MNKYTFATEHGMVILVLCSTRPLSEIHNDCHTLLRSLGYVTWIVQQEVQDV